MENILDEEKMQTIIEKVNLYSTEENLNIEDIKTDMEKIINFYQTKNKTKFENLNIEIFNKLEIIKKNHQSYIYILRKNLEKYKEVASTVESTFRNII